MHYHTFSSLGCHTADLHMLLIHFNQGLIIELILFEHLQGLIVLRKIKIRCVHWFLNVQNLFAFAIAFYLLLMFNISSLGELLS